ncbi:ERCC4 domain-containing protein [Nocardioides flavescens]|uniref:ERCC4 domain-containing protein n=1 Tax=Nocardioides flavescens TaxID=2691959 RepID=A0A6L7F3U5_9ACTN|nr:hypothetical protein [Nocardioides flavescens]
MPDDFVIARNPDPDSTLPYLLRIPLASGAVVLKARDTWPRTSKVYCHRAEEWPADAEVVERVGVRSCTRRGASIDLVLDRGRENRSQLVFAQAKGRPVIFWQSARTTRQARPAVAVPTARPSGIVDLEVTVDTHERYPWTFSDRQATVRRGALACGDYGVVRDDRLLAVVERKSLADLASSLSSGKLRYQLGELASVPRAAVVVEERYAEVFRHEHVRASVFADGLAECQVRWPSVPIVFCETRKLAQEWAFRFLGAALRAHLDDEGGAARVEELVAAGPLAPVSPATGPSAAELRVWAAAHGFEVSAKGRVPAAVRAAYDAALASATEGS